MKNATYWLWLQRALGFGAWIDDPVRFFGSAEALYETDERAIRAADVFGKTKSFSRSNLPFLLDKDLSFTETILERCEQNDIRVLTPDDADYPQSLLRLPDYPAVLFAKGSGAFWNEMRCLALIGARQPLPYAQNAAHRIGASLAKHQIAVISGGALGIDSAAHSAVLENGGKTVLVMGCGILYDYLPANRDLREQVAATGALISEYPPDMAASLSSFPLRNRIISGMSSSVIIVQAGERSGTLNTASHAKRQSKELLVVPGDSYPVEFAGSHQLIRDGARPVFSVNDVLRYAEFASSVESDLRTAAVQQLSYEPAVVLQAPAAVFAAEKEKPAHEPVDLSVLSEEAASVYRLLRGKTMQLDELVLCAGFSTQDLLAALTELELFGAVQKGEGNYYTGLE